MHALLLIDLQNDFLPGGALAAPRGDEVIPIANRWIERFAAKRRPIIATQDWHPPDHLSFASQHENRAVGDVIQLGSQPQTLWPDHCIQHTHGAAFAPDLLSQHITRTFPKGTNRNIDSYSGFYDNDHKTSTGLTKYLRSQGVTHLLLMGLATDFCVRATALDAVRDGFETTVDIDGCRGVNLQEGDSERAVAEMRHAGVHVQRTEQLEVDDA